MNRRIVLFLCYIVILLVGLGAIILRHERTLNTGAIFKFRTAPVDPVDAFRGRYVALRIAETQAPLAPGSGPIKDGDMVYVKLGKDDEGFAKIIDAGTRPPDEGPYILARADSDPAGGSLRLLWPFNRFYMEENAAPQAEEKYRTFSRSGKRDTWIVVRVSGGDAVIEDLIIGGQSAKKALRN